MSTCLCINCFPFGVGDLLVHTFEPVSPCEQCGSMKNKRILFVDDPRAMPAELPEKTEPGRSFEQ